MIHIHKRSQWKTFFLFHSPRAYLHPCTKICICTVMYITTIIIMIIIICMYIHTLKIHTATHFSPAPMPYMSRMSVHPTIIVRYVTSHEPLLTWLPSLFCFSLCSFHAIAALHSLLFVRYCYCICHPFLQVRASNLFM